MKLNPLIGLWIIFLAASCYSEEMPGNDKSGSITRVVYPSGQIVSCSAKRVDDGVIRVLFVGNSLTYSNEMPNLIEVIGKSKAKDIRTEVLAFPNYALEDHWNDNKMQVMICEGNFDFVVVQQGPSSQADGREMLFDYGNRIKVLCDSRGTELAFFLVWPAKEYYRTFEGVIKNYTDAANATQSLLCPVGVEFKMHGDMGNFWFYSADNFHPLLDGSQRAAEIIYSSLIK